jgi:hypothetical protein
MMRSHGTKIAAIFRQRPADLPEPSWDEVLTSPDERQAAAGYWRDATASSHAVLRLVTAYLVFDRVSAVNMRGGQIDVQAWNVQLAASQLAGQIEGDLGLSPRRRDP